MTLYSFQVTIPANIDAPVNLATAAIAAGAIINGGVGSGLFSATYLPCAVLILQMARGGTGVGFAGKSTLTYLGVGSLIQLAAATASVPGTPWELSSDPNSNTIDLSQFNVHGTNPGDLIDVSYVQA